MKGRSGLGALLAAVLITTGCNGVTTVAAEGGGGTASTATALEGEIHALVNQRRSDRRLPALQWDARIAQVAREHSSAMASGRRGFGHDGFDARAAQLGGMMTMSSMAENVAYDSRDGDRLASLVVAGWIASPGHRQNIEGSFTRTGVGVARGADGTRYFTQIFVDDG